MSRTDRTDVDEASSMDREPSALEVTESRTSRVGALEVRRALPRRGRRTVGAWCFIDHFGPVTLAEGRGLDIAPHPHIGLSTVTWLLAGEALHRDSLGSDQVIRPGQLNLMTAGRGIAHAEEGGDGGVVHGLQLWIAQPSKTRNGPPEFQHFQDLPRAELRPGVGATVLVGDFGAVRSPARHDTDLVGVDLDLPAGRVVLPLRREFEYAVVVCDGVLLVSGTVVEPGHLAYLATGRDELVLEARDATRAVLLGGEPFPEPLLMWWNFVARTERELLDAWKEWADRGERFGDVACTLARTNVAPPPFAGRGPGSARDSRR